MSNDKDDFDLTEYLEAAGTDVTVVDGRVAGGDDGDGSFTGVSSKKGEDDDCEEEDFYFGDEGENNKDDPFLSMIFINFMKSYQPVHAYDTVIREMSTRLENNIYHREWIASYDAMVKDYSIAHPDNKFILTREAFNRDQIVAFAHMAEKNVRIKTLPISNNTKVLAEILELSPVDTLFLQLAIRMSAGMAYCFHSVFEHFRYSELGENPARLFSKLFDRTEEEIKASFKGFLFQSGLLTTKDSHFKPFFIINTDMREAFITPHITEESLTEHLFPSNITTELTIADYPHLTTEIDRAERIITRGLVEHKKGVNVMFWGMPGTGKTELALMLAKKNDWQLRVIGDISDADNKEKSRAERLVSLKIALKIYGRETNTVLLFDEMEDLFKMDTNAAFSKAFINRIIETTTIPIIWTTNNLEPLGDAVLRRMFYNIPFEVPPVDARRAIWQRYTDKYDLGLSGDVIDNLAETYDTAPALIHNAAKITSMAGLESSEVPEIVQSLDRLVNYGEKRRFTEHVQQEDTYDLSCVNSETDLEGLTNCICTAKPNFSVLLYGPPGTGKSEYGRYVSKRLNRRFHYKRASDLMSMWVGGTEKNIAKAFDKAKKEEALLLIDEGDSFLRSREGAEHSWEVTQVNEMLSQMERHKFPFVMTTNLMKAIDPAAMRRFTFKMKFDFMRPDQSVRLFKRYFNVEAPRSIERMETLTPGDFANVRRRADIIHVTDAHKLVDMLAEELEAKPQKSSKMGF